MSVVAPKIFRGKHLVVFGAGYVGGAVAREAVARGMRVTALTRNTDKAAALAGAGIGVVTADLATDAWHGRIGAADFVLNSVSSGGGGAAGYRHSYVEGMRSVLAWAAGCGGAGTLVYTGSTSVYPQSGGAVVDESAPTDGAGETARLLLETEALLRGAAPAVCRRWFVLRLAGIYGPGRHHLLDALRAGETEFAGGGGHRLNLVHRDDIVAAVWAAFAAPAAVANAIFNVGDDGSATKAEVVGWLAARLGRPVPVFAGGAAAGRRAVVPDRVISNARIKAVLGWRPRYADFRAGYGAILGDGVVR